MKGLLLLCAGLLLLGLAELPIGYYTLLRIIVTGGSIAVVLGESKDGLSFWVLLFAFLAVLFNPIIPVYLNDKSIWIPINIISATVFITKTFILKSNQN